MIDRTHPTWDRRAAWEDPPERGLGPAGIPAEGPTSPPPEGFRTACVWLSSPLGAQLTEVGRALTGILSQGTVGAEFLSADSGGGEWSGPLRPGGHDLVVSLIDAATALVRRGVTTIVAYPLLDHSDVQLARTRIPPLVRVSLGPASPASVLDGIPTTYRCIRDRRIVEVAIPPQSGETPDRADVVVNGTLGSPDELSREIADVLYRAGWLSKGPVPHPVAPVPDPLSYPFSTPVGRPSPAPEGPLPSPSS